MGWYQAGSECRLVCVRRSLVKAEGCRSHCGRHAVIVSVISFVEQTLGKACGSTLTWRSDRLEKRPSIQLITVGPVIDLYGRFAAEKLARLMEMYPDRVYSKPEFTALPPYLFSGADFALIPSRDEPFGLVAVEFGRKGALGVGSRLGGLGLMPGWVSTASSLQGGVLKLTFCDAVVPGRVHVNGTHDVSADEDDQDGVEVYGRRACHPSCPVCRPTFPCRRMASTYGGLPQAFDWYLSWSRWSQRMACHRWR